MQKGFAQVYILLAVLALVALGVAYSSGKLSTKPNPQPQISTTPAPSVSLTPSVKSQVVAKFNVQVVSSGSTGTVTLSASDNGNTVKVPVGTYIYLRFGVGDYKYNIEPSQGVLEIPSGTFSLPKDVIGQAKAVGKGNATITVTKTPTEFLDQNQTDTSNWKTYTSTRYGFSLKYPTNVTYTERGFERVWKVSDSEPVSTSQEVETTFNVDGGTLIIVGNERGMGIASIKSSDVVIGGKKTAKFYRSETNGVISAIPSPKGDYIYFDFNLPDSSSQKENADQEIDQILSTFRFD